MRRKTNPMSSHRNNKRPHHHRGNNNKRRGQHPRAKVHEGKTKQQAYQGREKYMNMAQDAQRSGDRVEAEYFLQYVDHFSRILNFFEEQEREQEAQRATEEESWNDLDDAPHQGEKHDSSAKPDKPRMDKKDASSDAPAAKKDSAKPAPSEDDAPKRRGRPRKADAPESAETAKEDKSKAGTV
jgi:hypothetical protein